MAHGAKESAWAAQARGVSPVGPLSDTVLEGLCEELLARGGRVWRTVTSDSMAPLLRAGDRILVEPCAGRMRWGDVVVFRTPAGAMVHRVVAMRRGRSPRIIEKGDANPFAGAVDLDAVVGRVCRRDRGGDAVDFMRGRGRLIQLILAALSLAELGGLLVGRGLRRVLRIDRPTGAATRLAGLLRSASARIVRLLGSE